MLIQQIESFIRRHSLLRTGARVGVAVSGGADSVCLLHVLFELRSRWNLHLEVVHVNHLLRGADSDADEDFVRGLAQTLGLPFHCRQIDVAALGPNLEQRARDARRDVFLNLIRTVPLDCVALAHTRSDQAETVLFRFLRGAYSAGLAGMRPATAEGLIRPMLEIDRTRVENWLRQRGFVWREDRTNLDQSFARNRIRHSLLPALAAGWNPNLAELLAQYATLAQEDESYWESEVDRLAPLFMVQSGTAVIVSVTGFSGLPPALARRLIRRVLQHIKGDLREIEFRHIDAILKLMRSPSGHLRLQVPGVDVLRSFHQVRFSRPRSAPLDVEFELPLSVPGQVTLPGQEQPVCLEIIERQAAIDSALTPGRDTLGSDLDWNRIQSDVLIGSNSRTELHVRNWRSGDAYRRAGDRQERKLKSLFQLARVPIWERGSWPVLSAGGRILWVRGFGPADQYAASAESTRVLRITERAQGVWTGTPSMPLLGAQQ